MDPMKFSGVVSSRSSLPGRSATNSPPGEAELIALNPQRKAAILQATGWSDIFPGTLNIEVGQDVVDRLLDSEPVIREKGESVIYPSPFAHIPAIRKGYLYYRATVSASGLRAPALIRRAIVALPRRQEIFSETRLRDNLGVNDGDVVECEIVSCGST
jgi:CTP-dependent riboflavin kinase